MPTALVVDDSSVARHRVATMLHLGGWLVHEALSGDAALRIAGEVDLDLVVTDVALRDGSGATLLRRLRDQRCRAASVVVAARPTELVRAQAAAAGALACLAKPVDPRLFLDLMHGLAQPAQPPRPAPWVDPIRVSAHRVGHLEQVYAGALPHRTAVSGSGRPGAVPQGVLSHERLRHLLALSVANSARTAGSGQATSR